MSELMTLDIDSIAAGGDGVARHDGLVVFVPRTAPGDRVVARVERRKRFGFGRVERVERAGPARVVPECPHYTVDECGGCQLQHLRVDAQRNAKGGIVRDTLRRIGARDVANVQVHAAPSPWRYRQRISLAMRKRGDHWYGGFHALNDPDRVFALGDCLIADRRVMACWRAVEAAAADLPQADALRVTVRAGDNGAAITVEGGTEWPAAAAFVAALSGQPAVWWTPDGGRRRRIDASARVPAGASFAQVNPLVADALRALVRAVIVARRARTVVDAYAGVGDLAATLHADGIAVTAVEMDEEASAVLAHRIGPPSRAITARVEDVLAGLLPADVVVVNPPRAGVNPSVAAALESAQGVRALVYVSCDPATLARDLARMPSWAVRAVDCFDMFPQTAHVETVVVLDRGVAA